MKLDSAQIEQLYRSHGHLVLRRARILMGSEAEAQEALQEVFAALLREPAAVGSSAVGWIYRATTHFCLNQLRNRRTGARLLEAAAPVPAQGAGADLLVEVRSLLARLPPEVAAAAVYAHVDGMTHTEVAGLLGCSRRQVGYLLERARQQAAGAEKSA